jgi:hypothetical protein
MLESIPALKAPPAKPVEVKWNDGVVVESPFPMAPAQEKGFESILALCSDPPTFLSGRDSSMGLTAIHFTFRPGLTYDLDAGAEGMAREYDKLAEGNQKFVHTKKDVSVLAGRAIEIESVGTGGSIKKIRSLLFQRDRGIFILQMIVVREQAAQSGQWQRMRESFKLTETAKKPAIIRATGQEGLPPGMRKR